MQYDVTHTRNVPKKKKKEKRKKKKKKYRYTFFFNKGVSCFSVYKI